MAAIALLMIAATGWLPVALRAAETQTGSGSTAGPSKGAGKYTTVFLVRHAERANTSDESPLSAAGQQRAQQLQQQLRSVALSAIFVTEKIRSQQTAAPIAESMRLTPTTYVTADELGAALRQQPPGQNVLVVGHSNTLEAIVEKLSNGAETVRTGEEYDNLLVLLFDPNGHVIVMHRLHYGMD